MKILFILAIFIKSSVALWSCSSDLDCGTLGSVCVDGTCSCPAGQQPALKGTQCVSVAPYLSSPCYEDSQCDRLWTHYECKKAEQNSVGTCQCQNGYHYFLGSCWKTTDFGESCNRDEECLSTPRDPFALKCNGVCVCADGYYERQKGECRKIASAVGDGCVVDEDCKFQNGTCSIDTLTCADASPPADPAPSRIETFSERTYSALSDREVDAIHNVSCSSATDCVAPEICSFGACLCPKGFYRYQNKCYAELGTQSTADQCDGLFAVVINGVCTCPANFFYDTNMRDCIKVTRRISDSCVVDANCHTFGAQARCGQPQGDWGLRKCECITENAVWDDEKNMCRLYAGVGEQCEMNSDCMAGAVEITCVEGFCRCPPHLTEYEGLCLSSGFVLGDACQASLECDGTANAVCTDGVCSCASGFQQEGDSCAPVIGGPCAVDTDCVIEDTVCKNTTAGFICQCQDHLVAAQQRCYTVSEGHNATCSVSEQCVASMGEASSCVGGFCACTEGNHFRDGRCWPVTALFETCSRTSECYLNDMSEWVVCRNGRCQCDFDYPYSEELKTCTSSSTSLTGSIVVVTSTLLSLIRS